MNSIGEPGTDQNLSVESGTELNGMYVIDAPIALGGMAEVYRGHNIQTQDPVAIKIVLREYAHDEMILNLFRKEAKILFRLTDDAIVRYYGISVDEKIGRPYLAMEFVDGHSLVEQLNQGPLDAESVHVLRRRLAKGLQKAHELGVIHRDISPDNIILPKGRVDRAKIIDFGIARAAEIGEKTLLGGHFAGKYNFVSPEQLGLFNADVTPRSDIYSLGLVLAAALLGEPLDMNGNQAEIIEKRRYVPDLSRLDTESQAIIGYMLQPDPADRPQLMLDVMNWTFDGREFSNESALKNKTKKVGKTRIEANRPTFLQSSVATSVVIRDQMPDLGKAPLQAPIPDRKPAGNGSYAMFVGLVFVVAIAAGLGGWYYISNQNQFITTRKSAVLVAKPTPNSDKARIQASQGGQTGNGTLENQTSTERKQVTITRPVAPPTINSETENRANLQSKNKIDQSLPEIVKGVTGVVDYVRDYNGGKCFYATVSVPGKRSASVIGYGVSRDPFLKFSKDFERRLGYSADIQLRIVSQNQCIVIENLKRLSSKQTHPVQVSLNRDLIRSGQPLQGELTGLKGRHVALLLIDNEGFAYNLSAHLKGKLARKNFEVLLGGAKLGKPEPQLVLTLVSSKPLKALAKKGPISAAILIPLLVKEISSKRREAAALVTYFKLGG